MTDLTEYYAVLGGKLPEEPGEFAAVLGGKAAIAKRKQREWESRATEIFQIFTEATNSHAPGKKRTLSAIVASLKASEAGYSQRRQVYKKELKNPNPIIEYNQIVETFRHVRSLTITWSNLTDISLLGCCPFPELKELVIEQNQIKDMSAIGCFTQLSELYFHNNCVEDISCLSSLVNLKKIHFIGNAITDVSPLKHLKMLEDVWLNEGVSDITPLAGLDLKTLFANNCPLDQPSRRLVKQLRERGTAVYTAGTRKSLK